MIKDKISIPLWKCFAIWILSGLSFVFVLLGVEHFSQKDLYQGSLTVYLLQGFIFLLADLWVATALGIDFKAAFTDYAANIKNYLKLALKYYFAYALAVVAIIGVGVLICFCLIKMGSFDLAAFQKAHGSNSLRQPEMNYLYSIAVGAPFKYILYLITVCVLIPIEEEIFCRRFLYVSLRHKMLLGSSLIISSLIFGLEHWGAGPGQAVIAGLFLGWIYERHQRLPVNIMVHGLINFTVTIVMTFLAFG
jgi:membrane protease YdiL (CAAX protease family)